MRPRNRGSIVSVDSALAYRSVPLQSVYCGAKFAIRGFLDALRSELYHDKIKITPTEVDLPAINTPQFDWARNKTGHKAQPVPPIYQPEVAARAIYFGAFNPRRQIWVGFPTVKAIIANRIAPALLDRYLAKSGYTGQLSDQPSDPEAPGQLIRAGARRIWRPWSLRRSGAHGKLGDDRQPPPQSPMDRASSWRSDRRIPAGHAAEELRRIRGARRRVGWCRSRTACATRR
jgi:hypothetical protein